MIDGKAQPALQRFLVRALRVEGGGVVAPLDRRVGCRIPQRRVDAVYGAASARRCAARSRPSIP